MLSRTRPGIRSEVVVMILLTAVFLPSAPRLQAATVAPPGNVLALNGPDAQADGCFGSSVAADGNYIVVGAVCVPPQNLRASPVYVFNTSGSLVATLTSPTGFWSFGSSVAISGNHIVVGAEFENGSGIWESGRAYLFNTTGSLLATLTSPDPQIGGNFGSAVAVGGNYVVVGAADETAGGADACGHVYIFNTEGTLLDTLISPNPEEGEAFGVSVVMNSTSVVIGANGEDGPPGAWGEYDSWAYSFQADGSPLATLTNPSLLGYGNFGGAVAMNGNYIVVGASGEAIGGDLDAGRAYVFNMNGSLLTTLTSPNSQAYGNFGSSVAVNGTVVVVGAGDETAGRVSGAGRAYVFNMNGSLLTTLTSPNSQADENFGSSAAMTGTDAVIGAPAQEVGGLRYAGQVYVFEDVHAVASPSSSNAALTLYVLGGLAIVALVIVALLAKTRIGSREGQPKQPQADQSASHEPESKTRRLGNGEQL